MQYFHLLHQKTQAAQIANVSLAPVPVGGPVNNIPTVTGLPPISPSPASQSSIPATQILTTQTQSRLLSTAPVEEEDEEMDPTDITVNAGWGWG